MANPARGKFPLQGGLVVALLAPCASTPLHAEPSMVDVLAEIRALHDENRAIRAENRQMRAAISDMRGETRRTREAGRVSLARRPAIKAPPPGPVAPVGALPTFVTPNKKFHYGGVTITPGGFIAAESVFRSRTQQADIGSQYQGIPFGPQAGTNEFRFSARQSRIAALLEAPITSNLLVSGYGEFDFLGSGATSNSNESNSFVPRIRHLYATLDADASGFHVLAGQNWSLLTLNSKGITPRNELIPPTIDSQYVPGFVWKRQPQIRVTQDFDRKLWLALSAEQPQTTFTGCTAGVNGTTVPGPTGVGDLVTCQLGGNNNLNPSTVTNFSLNHVPDVVGKLAYEAYIADRDVHLEALGIYRNLFDRVAYTSGAVQTTASNRNTTGYGFGGGLIVPLVPKRLDFELSGLVGRGIGSYGTAQFMDATFASDGAVAPVREQLLLGGLTFHATSAIDVYAFAGVEQVQANIYTTNAAGTAFAGYGSPTANNSGCFNTITLGSCAGNAKRVFQVTGGLWDKIYKSDIGEVRVGLQYSYTQRELFQGSGGTAAAPALAFAPKQNDQLLLTSLRYYPFQ